MAKVYVDKLEHYMPDGVLDNDFFASSLDTTKEWIESATGIKRRRFLKDYNGHLGTFELAKRLLDKKIKKEESVYNDVDFIITGSGIDDLQYPSLSSMVAGHLGLNIANIHLKGACSSAIYALFFAHSLIKTGAYKRVLVVVAEAGTKIQDYTNRKTSILWGDGAASFIVSKEKGEFEISSMELGGEPSNLIHTGGPGKRPKKSIEDIKGNIEQDYGYGIFDQNGKAVYRFILKTVGGEIEKFLSKNKLSPSKVDYMITHQANLVMQNDLLEKLGIDKEKQLYNVDECGNTGGAGCMMVLSEATQAKKIKSGNRVLVSAFGAGILWGNAILRKTR